MQSYHLHSNIFGRFLDYDFGEKGLDGVVVIEIFGIFLGVGKTDDLDSTLFETSTNDNAETCLYIAIFANLSKPRVNIIYILANSLI